MRSYDQMNHHPVSEKLVGILCEKTQNTNPGFYRVLVGYYFSMIASMMRCSIKTHDRGSIPVNCYCIDLAPSGYGKGLSTNVIEDQVIDQFKSRFIEETFPVLAADHLPKLAHQRAIRKAVDPDEELARVEKEFDNLGPLVFSFDSGTSAAVKQARHKLLMAQAGSMNLQIDEIGSNLLANVEVLNTFLELYDVGKIKQKLVKNTSDNLRYEDVPGRTPTNMLLFGTPAKLLNGGKAEEEFYSMLETGYARRSFFGFIKGHARNTQLTVDQVYSLLVSNDTNTFLQECSDRFNALADIVNLNKQLVMSETVAKLFIEYRLKCEQDAEKLPEHEEMRKAEMSHRYFKAMKLAGAYAFVDDAAEITEENAYQAIKLAEESGMAFRELLTRDRPYVKLARYMAEINRPVTQADLVDDLPFYPKAANQRSDMMSLAIAWGYQNNVIIKKAFNDGVEFLRGETLKRTNLDELLVSYSTDIAVGYKNDFAPWDKLHVLTQSAGLHWVNHHLKDGNDGRGHRQEDDCLPGFSMVVLDVDGGVDMAFAKKLLTGYKAFFYTTKRHTDQAHRFRIVLPLNYELKLDARDFKEFMKNIYDWLPFEVDDATGQRARKWMSHNGSYEYLEGELLDVLPFIPKTSKNEEHRRVVDSQQSLDNLERWFVNNTGDGNRNKQLHRYALILVDAGFDFEGVRQKVLALNEKLPDNLEEAEIMSTIMVTAGKALTKPRAAA